MLWSTVFLTQPLTRLWIHIHVPSLSLETVVWIISSRCVLELKYGKAGVSVFFSHQASRRRTLPLMTAMPCSSAGERHCFVDLLTQFSSSCTCGMSRSPWVLDSAVQYMHNGYHTTVPCLAGRYQRMWNWFGVYTYIMFLFVIQCVPDYLNSCVSLQSQHRSDN